jgi:hypothetical protein
MRVAEIIHLVVFPFFVVLAWLRPLPAPRRVKVTTIGAAGISATLIAALALPRLLPPLAVSVVRDWLPASLVLLVYWQAGAFFLGVNQGFQDWLARADARYAAPLLRFLARPGLGHAVAGFLELSYLLCYPMIPMCVGALYVLRLARHSDQFWTVVLISTYLSYGVLPFVQTLPPRMLNEPWLPPMPLGAVRRFNLWILRNASIHANTFPSAHVAASVSAALVLARFAPAPVAVVFLILAAGITFGTFAGRYHFAADAVAGSAVAMVVFFAILR